MTTRGINRATVLGYLGRDPRITTTVNGGLRAHISIATTEMWQNENDETVERIDWHQIVAFGRFAEVIRDHCRKRTKLYVEGPMQTRQWVDGDGMKHFRTEIIAQNIQFVANAGGERFPPPWGEKRDSSENPGEQSDAVNAVPDEIPPMDDLSQPDEPLPMTTSIPTRKAEETHANYQDRTTQPYPGREGRNGKHRGRKPSCPGWRIPLLCP